MKKAILYMALALPLGMNLNACDKDSEETKEPRFCRNYKDLVKVNVFYNGSCNGRKAQGTQTYPTLITIPEVEEPKTPTQVVKKPSIHCNLNLLKEISETPTLKLGYLSQLEPINVCCEDKYAQVFTRAKAKKLEINQAIVQLCDHAYKQKAFLNELKVGIETLLRKDPSQAQFRTLRNGISEAMAFYDAVNESYFKDAVGPLNAILDIYELDKCKSKKLKKTETQIELYNASLNNIGHKLRDVRSCDTQTNRILTALRSAIKKVMIAEEGQEIDIPAEVAKPQTVKVGISLPPAEVRLSQSISVSKAEAKEQMKQFL